MNQQFIQSLSIDWNKIEDDSYLREIEAINKLKEVVFEKPITFFVGENGSGKSTLLEALAVSYGFNPEGGTKNYSFSTFDSHSELYNAIRISKGFRKAKWGYFLRAESFYNVATKELEYSDWAHPSEKYHEKSHGESFLALTQNHLRPNGLYLFDEPEAGIDLWSFTGLIDVFRDLRSHLDGSLVIISHQERILAIADEIVVIADGVVQQAGPRALVLPGLLDGAAGCTQCPNKEVGKQ